ncbi:MAG: ycgE [Variovorax sp.]|nr:ycgE [Variovorax sp.]
MEKTLPAIPAKRYFTIGEVGELCDVKPHVLRYWEQEFTQLRPMKRRGNRRYYQHHEVLMIRRIRELLYDQGFTINGARNRLQELAQLERGRRKTTSADRVLEASGPAPGNAQEASPPVSSAEAAVEPAFEPAGASEALLRLQALRQELLEIRQMLTAVR